MQQRQIFLDTETTGLEPSQGHRVIEIGCVELINRKLTGHNWHFYLNPEREIDDQAFEVHGLSSEFLSDKPKFIEVADDFLQYITGAELIIHNAPFDVGFLDHELKLIQHDCQHLSELSSISDSLLMARQKYPGQKNNLDALCKRLEIDNTARTLHGALLDAEILADVYLAMTGGQVMLSLDVASRSESQEAVDAAIPGEWVERLMSWSPDQADLDKHHEYIDFLKKNNDLQAW